jgi:hypothetical protein
MKTSPIIVNEIRRLSQQEGLRDAEIAEIIQYNRVSVQKIRKAYEIPTYNKMIRKDKVETCPICNSQYYIRRNEQPGICCPACSDRINKGELT